MEKSLSTYFKENNIKFKEYSHPPVFTVAESHLNPGLKNIPGLRTKNLFLRDEKSNFYLYVCPGEIRVNLKSLKSQLNVKEIHFGSPEELKKELNISPGSVSLFCMIHAKSTILLIDSKVWNAEQAGFHPNINTSTLVLEHSDIERFCNSLNIKYRIINLENE